MKHRGTKILSLLLSLVLVLGLMPGMSAWAYSPYGLSVGGVDVDDSHLSGEGWSYAPATNTLTLNGATIAVAGGNGIYSFRETLNIVLSNNSTNTVSSLNNTGINCQGKLSISGGGSLTVSGSGGSSGIFCRGLEISGGSVDASGASRGIRSSGTITISGGTVTATSTNGEGISSEDTITISGGSVDASGASRGIRSSGTITISGGTVTATSTNNGEGFYSDDTITISNGSVTATGSQTAIFGNVKNSIAGTGWTNTEGTEGQATIAVSTEVQDLGTYKKVQFPAAADSFTVTYDPGRGSGTMEPTKVSKNDEGKYIYKVESCGFTAPEGETFESWLGSDAKTYRPGPEVEISGDLTLTAQWKDEKKPDDGGKKASGGNGFDIVFNIPGADNSWEYVGGYAPQQAYRVSLAPMQGGSAALGLTTGDSGTQMNVYPSTTVYVFPNAEQGYTLDKIVWSLIDGSASYDITEAKNFVMPAMDAVVYVTFRPVG